MSPDIDPDIDPELAHEIERVVPVLEGQVKRDYAPPQVKRDAHPKMHGCVLAELTVSPTIASDLRHGVFSTPDRSFKTWVRFSNAFRIQHDLKFDTRGMGIKLLEVEGTKLGDELHTQDFLFATWPAFFLPNGTDYHVFARGVGEDPPETFGFYWKRRMCRAYYHLIRSSLVMARNPLAISYFSQTPYQLGPLEVKLQARPRLTPELNEALPAAWVFRCQALIANAVLGKNSTRALTPAAEAWCAHNIRERNFLRVDMMRFLAKHAATFDILVQRRTDKDAMPINDATRRWSEWRSPFEKVATLTIPPQIFWPDSRQNEDETDAVKKMMTLGENMSFNPWHALEAHRPLGDINKMRQKIYPAIVNLRHEKNQVPPTEPKPCDFDDLAKMVRK